MGIFGPGWKSTNTEKALRWIEKQEPNSNELQNAVCQSMNSAVQAAALARITDQRILAEMIEKDLLKKDDLKNAAFDRITEPSALKILAKHCHDIAIKKVTDQRLLYEIASADRFFTDDKLLSYWARMNCRSIGPYEYCAEIAANSLTDCDLLLQAAKRPLYRRVSQIVIPRLRDAGVADMGALAADPEVPLSTRLAAVRCVNDTTQLRSIADDQQNPEKLRHEAIRTIKDPSIRIPYCETMGTHEWEHVETLHNEVGDTDYLTHIYRCEFCGKEEREQEAYRL